LASILVTGAEGGIGTELVSLLLENGDRVFAAQLSPVQNHPANDWLHPIHMDVGDDASVRDGFAEIDRLLAGSPLDAVVHCAAIAPLGPVEVLPLAMFKDVFNINTMGSLRVIHEAMPRLTGHGGMLILVTSLWGRVAGPMIGAYAASKHAVEALADSIRRETRSMDFHVVVVEPGVVRTGMLQGQLVAARTLAEGLSRSDSARYGGLYRRYAALVAKSSKTAITARSAALRIAKILRSPRPRARYRLGQDAKLVCALARLLPDWAMDHLFQVMLGRP
jgi:NAD(P)-dependent dehydrogenase (short-subunit alcohol dehydrogenase family)